MFDLSLKNLYLCLFIAFIHFQSVRSDPLEHTKVIQSNSIDKLSETLKNSLTLLRIQWVSILNNYRIYFRKLKFYNKISDNSLIVTLLLISIPSLIYFNSKSDLITKLLNSLSNIMNGGSNGSSGYTGSSNRRKLFGRKRNAVDDQTYDLVFKKGGNIGGLINDGNTCFMNSVLQSLSSSNTLVEFIEDSKVDGFKSDDYELNFTKSLRQLLHKLNNKHFNKNSDYRTNPLLKNMTKSPNKNFLMGYNQEDAQEFFQSLLFELESDFKRVFNLPKNPSNNDPILINDLPENAIIGLENLGSLGNVYIPADQIDPNLENSNDKVFKYNLLTPVDGLTAERIGCIECGENGGIRYNVFSGLSLNLPTDNYNALKLSELLQKWIEPEIIEGVDCNRCALSHVLEYQKIQLQELENQQEPNEKLIKLFKIRIDQILKELSKPIIDDEIIKKLSTKNMTQKASKSKQILISRPPPLLSIHINRSVFDPRTYRVRKNNARVLFPLKFDLDPFVASPDEINTDARLPMSKKLPKEEEEEEIEEVESVKPEQQEEEAEEEDKKLESEKDIQSEDELPEEENKENGGIRLEGSDAESETEELVNEKDSDEDSDEESSDEEPLPNSRIPVQFEKEAKSGPLVYQLRSVIVHYGTHNYGHYIAFRKFRGVWWRTSDEDIEIVSEEEVLSTPGVFMLFYELDSLSESIDKKREEIEEDLPVEVNLKQENGDVINEGEKVGSVDDDLENESGLEQAIVMANL